MTPSPDSISKAELRLIDFRVAQIVYQKGRMATTKESTGAALWAAALVVGLCARKNCSREAAAEYALGRFGFPVKKDAKPA